MAKQKVMSVRWSASEWALVQDRARRSGVSVSDYVRDRCLLPVTAKSVRDRDLLIHRLSQLNVALESARAVGTGEAGEVTKKIDLAISALTPALEVLLES